MRPLLSPYLRKPGKGPLDKSYVIASMGRQCQARGELGKVRDWLNKAALLQRKYGRSKWYKARTLFFAGKLSAERGEYGRTEEELKTAVLHFREMRYREHQVLAVCALAWIYLLTHRTPQAEEVLVTALDLSKCFQSTTYSSSLCELQGRTCTSQQQFDTAKEWLHRALALQEVYMHCKCSDLVQVG